MGGSDASIAKPMIETGSGMGAAASAAPAGGLVLSARAAVGHLSFPSLWPSTARAATVLPLIAVSQGPRRRAGVSTPHPLR